MLNALIVILLLIPLIVATAILLLYTRDIVHERKSVEGGFVPGEPIYLKRIDED